MSLSLSLPPVCPLSLPELYQRPRIVPCTSRCESGIRRAGRAETEGRQAEGRGEVTKPEGAGTAATGQGCGERGRGRAGRREEQGRGGKGGRGGSTGGAHLSCCPVAERAAFPGSVILQHSRHALRGRHRARWANSARKQQPSRRTRAQNGRSVLQCGLRRVTGGPARMLPLAGRLLAAPNALSPPPQPTGCCFRRRRDCRRHVGGTRPSA